MIEFKGEISEEGKILATRELVRRLIISIVIVSFAVVTLPAMILLILYFDTASRDFKFYLYMFVFCSLAILTLMVIYSIVICKSRKSALSFSKYVEIPSNVKIEDNIIEIDTPRQFRSEDIDKISKVFDYGDFYMVKFITYRYIIQKDLIASGTIEEFEALFEGKIIGKGAKK